MKQTMAVGNGITEGVIWKQLLRFFFPILLGTFLQYLYNTVDAVIVGRYLGTEALAAVGGTTGNLINLLLGFFVGFSSGASVIISQFYGARNDDGTGRAVHTAVALGLAAGVVVMAVGFFLFPQILVWMGTPPEVQVHASVYMRIFFLGAVFSLTYNMGAGILRAVGDSRRPLYFLGASCLLNLVLDLLFIAGFGMGVGGAALATIISQGLSAVLVILSLTKSQQSFRLELSKIRFDLPILRRIVLIGIPIGLQSMMYAVSNIALMTSINSLGTKVIAAFTAYGKIDGIFWMVMDAFGISMTTFVGQNYGAGRMDRVRSSVRVGLTMAGIVTVGLSAGFFLLGPTALRAFTTDPQVLERGMDILRIQAPFYLTFIFAGVLSGAIRGTGNSFVPMLITAYGIGAQRVLWALLVFPLSPTLQTVFWSYPYSWASTSLIFVVYYLRGRWAKPVTPPARQEAPQEALSETPSEATSEV